MAIPVQEGVIQLDRLHSDPTAVGATAILILQARACHHVLPLAGDRTVPVQALGNHRKRENWWSGVARIKNRRAPIRASGLAHP